MSHIAIVHFVNYKRGTQSRAAMRGVMLYVMQEKKTTWEQDGIVWLVSPAGKIVEQKTSTAGYPTIDGCRLLAPSVGTQIALDSDYETQRQSLLKLLAALEEAGKLGEVNAIHLGDLSCISMDYMDRFTVKLDYDADFAYELQLLEMSIASDKIQDNMTGTFDMRQREDGSIHFRQNVRG